MTHSHRRARDAPRDSDAEWFVLGDRRVGAAVADSLRAKGYDVSFVGVSPDREPSGPHGAPPDAPLDALNALDASNASGVVVATGSDGRNLLVAQLVRARFDVPRTVVLANAPDRIDAFADAGHEPVCATTALSNEIIDTI